MTTHTPQRGLAALLAIFFALALLYNWASPLFENSDEFFHYPFIQHLKETGLSLPVQSGDDLRDWRQQGSQPPIYHILSAILISPLDTSDYPETRRINPHARIGVVSESNINAVIHPLDRSAEFQGGTAWAVRLVRLFSTFLAAVVVVMTYWQVTLTFPDIPRWVGLLGAALVAFNPMYLFVASSINNDNMSNALISSVLVLLIGLYRQDDKPAPRAMLLIGVLLGLSLLSKLSTGPFMLLVGLFWLAMALRFDAFWYMVRWGFATLGLALLISGWWYIRNWQLYGDPTGLNVFLDIVERRPIPLAAGQVWSERASFIQAFWGLFGGLTVPMVGWVYSAFNALAALSLGGALLFFVCRARRPAPAEGAPPRPVWERIDLPQVVLIAWPLMALFSVVRWTALTWATQGRLWYIALPALATLSAVGFYELARRVKSPALAWAPAAFALSVAVAAPFVWLRPAYAAPELTPYADQTTLAIYSDPAAPADELALVDFRLPERIRAGESARVAMTLCNPTTLTRDWSVFVHLVNEFDIILAQADFTPGGGAIPTSELPAGQCWRDVYPISVEAGVVPTDTPLRALVGFYDPRTDERMVRADNATRYAAGETLLEVGDALQRFALGDALRVDRYDLSTSVALPGETLTLALDWRVIAPLETDYIAFVQIINPADAYRAAASDRPPEGGTAAWAVGETVTDTHALTIADDAPPGVYAVLVGFYTQPEPGVFRRMRVAYEGIDTGFDALTLTQVRVTAD